MRYLPMILGAGLLSAGLLASSGPAHSAMPTLALDRSTVADTLIEKAGYYFVFAFRGVFYDPLRELRLNALNQCSPRCPGDAILATRYQKPAPKRLAHAARRQGYVLFCEALDVPPLGAQTLGQRSPTMTALRMLSGSSCQSVTHGMTY